MAPKPETLKFTKLADRSEGERLPMFRVPAATTPRRDPETGDLYIEVADCERILFNPATPAFEHEPWPLAGIRFEGDPPKCTRVSTRYISRGVLEGWISLEGVTLVHRPGGPQEEPWRVTHTFVQAETITFDSVAGPVRYRVLEQPDKWPAEKNELDEGFGGDVRWYYDLQLEEA